MKIAPHEQRTLIIGGGIAALILLYVFALSPLLDDLSRKRELIPKKERDLAEMRVLREQYQELQKRLQEAQAAARKRGPLLTEIEGVTRRANLAGKVSSLKPQGVSGSAGSRESLVEVRLDGITLYDIVNCVYLLEKATLRIRKLTFKPRFDDPKRLNATLVVSSPG